MAGRPRTMVNRVERFEVAAFALADAIFQSIPQQYRHGYEAGDWIGESWNEGLKAAVRLWTTVEDLGDLVREKAGIERDGPTAECRLIRRSTRPALDELDFNPLDVGAEQPSAPERGLR